MLIVNDKYQLTEIRILRFLFITSFLTGAIAGLFKLLPELPSYMNIALSIPLALVGSYLFEIKPYKKRVVYDEDTIAEFFTRIKNGEEEYVREFCLRFLKVRSRNSAVLHINKLMIIEDMELLCSFIITSFSDAKKKMTDTSRVCDLYEKVKKRGSPVAQDYGLSLDNLAFLYELNARYWYNGFSIGTKVELDYILKQENLKLKHFLVHHPILYRETKDDIHICFEYANYQFPNMYLLYFTNLHYNDNNGGLQERFRSNSDEMMTHVERNFVDLLALFLEFKEKEELSTLTWYVVFDMLMMLLGYPSELPSIWHQFQLKSKIPEYINTPGEFKQYLEGYLSKNDIFYHLYFGLIEGFDHFLNNEKGFALSQMYMPEILGIYKNEMNRRILGGDVSGYELVLEQFEELQIESREVRLTWQYEVILYKALRNKLLFGNNISSVIVDYSMLSESYGDQDIKNKSQYEFSHLAKLDDLNSEEAMIVLKEVLAPRVNGFFLKQTKLYYHQTFIEFSRNISDKNEL